MIKAVIGFALLTIGAAAFGYALTFPNMRLEMVRAVVWAGSSITLAAAAVTGVFLISGRRL